MDAINRKNMSFFIANISDSPSLAPQNPIYQTFQDTYDDLVAFSSFTLDLNRYLRSKSPRLYLFSDVILTEMVSGLVDEPGKAIELILVGFPGLKEFIFEGKQGNNGSLKNNSGKNEKDCISYILFHMIGIVYFVFVSFEFF